MPLGFAGVTDFAFDTAGVVGFLASVTVFFGVLTRTGFGLGFGLGLGAGLGAAGVGAVFTTGSGFGRGGGGLDSGWGAGAVFTGCGGGDSGAGEGVRAVASSGGISFTVGVFSGWMGVEGDVFSPESTWATVVGVVEPGPPNWLFRMSTADPTPRIKIPTTAAAMRMGVGIRTFFAVGAGASVSVVSLVSATSDPGS